jgi:hypothetical protein
MAIELECLSTYGCANEEGEVSVKGAPYEAVYTPYCALWVAGKEIVLQTGNESAPGTNHHTLIKSFEYGCQSGTGGCGVKFEIIDEGGVLYQQLVQGLNKDISFTLSAVTGVNSCEVEFGWIVVGCNGEWRKITNKELGSPLFFLPKNVETTFEGGLIKFTFEATDIFTRSSDTRLDKNIGTEDDKVHLKEALQRLFRNKDPQFEQVIFENQYGDSGDGDFEFEEDPDGPRGVWTTDQESQIECARKWLNKVRTVEKNGCLAMYDPKRKAAVIKERPEDKGDCCDNNNLGTYIVNGGNSSPVISFNPNFKWNLGSNASSGGTSGAGSSARQDVKAVEEEGIQNTGTETSPTNEQCKYQWQDPGEHTERTEKTFQANMEAAKPFEVLPAIEAELRIIGDPTLNNPVFLTGKWISIVVIDPYYIAGGESDNTSCEWISKPNCNPILSNKKWMILGANHQIQSGSYVTTLKVSLNTPNINISASETLGGDGCGTEQAQEATGGEPLE